jgi:tight adherence protein B
MSFHLGEGAAAVGLSLVCGLLFGVVVLALTTRRISAAKRVGAYIDPIVKVNDPQKSLIERALGDKQARSIARSPFMTRLRIEMEVADLNIPFEQLVLGTLVLTLFLGFALDKTTHSPIAALMCLGVPWMVKAAIGFKAGRQRRNFMEQLPDNLQVVASAMRAGQNFVGALRSVLDDAPEPSKRELRRAVLDEQLGVPLVEALGQVTERMQSEDFQHVAVVAALQRETGGNTAEVIDLVSDTIRERIEIRRMVRGLTAQGRLSGYVLSLMPVGLLVMISLINPAYVHPLFHKTTGLIGLGIGGFLVLCGGITISKIVDIKV